MHSLYVMLSLWSALATAIPAPAQNTALQCAVVKYAVTALKAQATATSYCSSYLSLTATTSLIPGPTSYAFATDSACYAATATGATQKKNKRQPEPTAPPKADAEDIEKRAATTTVVKPAVFGALTKSADISAACSCLAIPSPSPIIKQGPTVTIRTTSFNIRSSLNNMYLEVLRPENTGIPDPGSFAATQQSGNTWKLVQEGNPSQCRLIDQSYYKRKAGQYVGLPASAGYHGEEVDFLDAQALPGGFGALSGFTPKFLDCGIVPSGTQYQLNCKGVNGSVPYQDQDNNVWYVGAGPLSPTTQQVITVYAEPVPDATTST